MAGIDLKEVKRTKNKTKKEVVFTGIDTPKYLENKIAKFNRYMVRTIRERFENKVLKKLNKGTIEKFQDAQTGNYAVIYTQLFNEFKKSVNKQFNEKKIEKFLKQLFLQADNYNQKRFYQNVNNTIGIDLEQVLKTDGLNSFINAKTLQSTDELEKLKSDTIVAYKTNVLRRMSAGDDLSDLYQEVKKQTGMRLKRSDLIARNELKSFNSELAKKRAQNNGIKKAIWRTAKDERVRGNPSGKYPNAPCKHWFWDGQEYEVGKGIKCEADGNWYEPGEAINCRCVAKFVINFD